MSKIIFNIRTTVICILLSICFFRLSYWQYNRYHQKLAFIEELNSRLLEPVVSLKEIIESNKEFSSKASWSKFLHKRISIDGVYDFQNEIIIKNRRFHGVAGSLVLTPIKFEFNNKNFYVFVNRGFIPFDSAKKDLRTKFHRNQDTRDPNLIVSITGFIKEDAPKKLFAPSDEPRTESKQQIDEWLRVDLQNIKQQLPYDILPIYIEKLNENTDPKDLANNLINTTSEKKEMLSMVTQSAVPSLGLTDEQLPYPLPDTYVSPGRHYEYIWEWAIMGLGVLVIGFVLQLKRRNQYL